MDSLFLNFKGGIRGVSPLILFTTGLVWGDVGFLGWFGVRIGHKLWWLKRFDLWFMILKKDSLKNS